MDLIDQYNKTSWRADINGTTMQGDIFKDEGKGMDGNDKGKARKGDKGLGKGRTVDDTIHELMEGKGDADKGLGKGRTMEETIHELMEGKGDKGLGKGRTMEETIHDIKDLVNERAHSRWGHDFRNKQTNKQAGILTHGTNTHTHQHTDHGNKQTNYTGHSGERMASSMR